MICAVFDLDGTLYTGSVVKGIAKHHLQYRVKLPIMLLYYIIHTTMWRLMLTGILPEQPIRERVAADMGWTVMGWTPERAIKAFDWVAENYVLPKIRPDVIARLQEHKSSGHRLILVSGTCSPLLARIGYFMGIEETVGTPLKVKNGRYTGGSIAPACQGPNKVYKLEQHLQITSSISWSESYAYADSKTDIALLQRFGHPVATYPDDSLHQYAQTHGWEIID
jgi:HAD superfamily hydrolase (TIGR01490 family)